MGTILGRNLKSMGFLMHKVTRHPHYSPAPLCPVKLMPITAQRISLGYVRKIVMGRLNIFLVLQSSIVNPNVSPIMGLGSNVVH